MPSLLESLILARPDVPGALILIEGHVLARLHRFRQVKDRSLEAGGILIGFRRGQHIHVIDATQPYRSDRRTRMSFERAATGHAAAALKRWQKTEMTADYVGEWHTHPESEPSPSGTDLNEWAALLGQRTEAMVFAIVGTERNWFGIGSRASRQVLQVFEPTEPIF